MLDRFKENYKAITASFLLAFILWFTVTTNEEYTTRIEVPFGISRVAPGKILANVLPENIELEVRGKGRSLVGLNFVETSFVLDLPEVTEETSILLSEYVNYINLPSDLGIEILDIVAPKSVTLKVEDFISVKKPVAIQKFIRPTPGYILMNVTSDMDSVQVSGPKSLIEPIKNVLTDSIISTDQKYPFQVNARIINSDPEVVKIDPRQIKVSFQLEQLVERNIYNIPIQVVRVPEIYNAVTEPTTILLRVKGGQSKISELNPSDISVIFDYSKDYRSDQSEYPMQIETPIGVSWLDASPKKFKLKLMKKE